jgi:3D (Asp-Asp-Asp) domain-containing protein
MADERRAVARLRAAAVASLTATALALGVAVVPRAASASRAPLVRSTDGAARVAVATHPVGQTFPPLRAELRVAYNRRVALRHAARVRQLTRRSVARHLALARARVRARAEARARREERAHVRAMRRAAAGDRRRRERSAALGHAQALVAGSGYSVVGQLTVEVTAYWPDPSWSNGYTATGVRAQYGVVAVDPAVIPLGTHLFVPGYGQAVAADTGGAIIGDHIDLCFNSESAAVDWGVQYLTIDIERPAS